MATSGVITGTKYASGHLWLTFEWNRSSYSVDKNTSTISWKLVLHCDNTLNFSADKTYTITVNGVSYSGVFTNNISWGSSGGTATIKTGTTSISHNTDGTKIFSVSAYFKIQVTYSGVSLTSMSLSGKSTLNTIPRASTLTLSKKDIYPHEEITISIKRASTSFTHRLKYTCGKLSGTIANQIATSTLWKIPIDIVKQNPNVDQNCTIQCETYNGSTLVGTKSITFTIHHFNVSQIKSVSGNIIGESVTIQVERQFLELSHKLYYSFGSQNKVLMSDTVGTNYIFKPSIQLCNQIPNSTSGKMTLILETYYKTQKIGQDYQGTYAMNVPSHVKPVLNSVIPQCINPSCISTWNIYLKNISQCQLNVNAQGSYGSKITEIYINNVKYTSSYIDKSLNIVGRKNYSIYVVDSRGRKSETMTQSIQIIDYSIPTLKVNTIYRCNQNGNSDDEGDFVKINASFSITSCSNKNNSIQSIQYKESTSSYYSSGVSFENNTDIILNGFEMDKTYDFLITVQDTVGKKAVYIGEGIIPTSKAIIDILKGGNGIAFGKMASDREVIDCGWNLRVPVIEDRQGNPIDLSNVLVYIGEE